MPDPNTPTPVSDASAQPTPVSTPAPTPGASIDPAAVQASMAPFQQKEQAAYGKAASLADQPTTSAPGPHARLLAMVQGLSLGLSAASTSLATHGQEGGAKEVQQVRAAQQEQQQRAQEAATAQKNAQIQQQLMIADTNHKLAQNVMLMATLPSELTQKDLETRATKLDVIGKTQDVRTKALQDLVATGDLDAYNTTIQQVGAASGAVTTPSGTTPTPAPTGAAMPAAGGVPPAAVATWKNATDAAVSAYPNDPTIKQYAGVLADPNADPKQMAMAATGAKNRMTALDAGTESRSKQEAAAAASTVGKLSTPEALAAPGSQAAIQAKIDDPTTSPADVPRLRALLPQAAVAQFNAENIKAREARNQQIVNQGTPDDAGRLLANRSLTLSELKSRQVTPAFIAAATEAAQKYDPTFKAAESEGQSKIAGSPANQQFFGNTDSLLVKGGTLDQLDTAGSNLGNMQLPVLNTMANWSKAALGQGPQAAYAAAALGVADDYSKVMTGGTGSDTSRLQALDIINRDQSPEGRAAAIAQIRQAVASQRQGRVGTNPYLRDMYPDPTVIRRTSTPAGSAASKVHANLDDFTHVFNSKKGPIYSDDGRIWYDQTGNLIPSASGK